MNKRELFETLSDVDTYSQLSCLGSMTFTVTAEAIRAAVKIIPDHPTAASIEHFLNEERNLKLDVEYAGLDEHGELVNATHVTDVQTTPGNYWEERRTLAALLHFRRDLMERSDELASTTNSSQQGERTLSNTLEFMLTQKQADPIYYARQFTTMMKLGGKNYGQTKAQYVQQEMERQARDADVFASKGEHAVQYLEGLDLVEGELSERLIDACAKRCVAKLIARRMKVGQSLNWRTDPDQRANAEADIICIEEAIVEFGGTVPSESATPAEADDESYAPKVIAPPAMDMAAMMAMMVAAAITAANQPQVAGPALGKSVRIPGNVTIIR